MFPVAGLGTRLLPATKSIPKEMITIVDRPLIQYAVDEAREAGIEQMIFVTGRGKSALVDYFDHGVRARGDDARQGQEPRRRSSRPTPGFGEIVTVRQQQPLGLGHAVWCARHIVGDEPFAVLLPDELMAGTPDCLAQMVEAYEQVGGNIVAALEVPDSETHKYGVIDPGATDGRADRDPRPGREAGAGHRAVEPDAARPLHPPARGDARARRAGDRRGRRDPADRRHGQADRHSSRSTPYRFEGERYDCGSAAGFVIANLAMALEREGRRARRPATLSRRFSLAPAASVGRASSPICDRPLDHARVERRIVLLQALQRPRARSIRRSIRANSTSKWNGLRITSSAPAS